MLLWLPWFHCYPRPGFSKDVKQIRRSAEIRSRTNALVLLPTTPHRHTLTAAADKTSRLRIWVTTRRTANRSDLHQNQLLITMAAITSLSGWD